MRRTYVVTYDVSDDKRRSRVFKCLEGYGDHVQYSVFFCELNEAELIQMRTKLRGAIHHREDQVLIIDMGPAGTDVQDRVDVIGRAYSPPVRTIVV